MKKVISIIACFALVLSLFACSESAPATIYNDDFIADANKALKSTDYSQYTLSTSVGTNHSDPDVGDCTYRVYKVETGVTVYTFSDIKTDEILKIRVFVDEMFTPPSGYGVAGFLIYNLIAYFDHADIDAITTKLGIDNISSYAVTEATGVNGTYQFAVLPEKALTFIYISEPSPETTSDTNPAA